MPTKKFITNASLRKNPQKKIKPVASSIPSINAKGATPIAKKIQS